LLTSETPKAAIRPPTTIEINIGSPSNAAEKNTPNTGAKLVKIAVFEQHPSAWILKKSVK
jgi:hypothetical protein